MLKLIKNFKLTDSIFIFIIIASSFITYINILPNRLFFDDEELIYKNAYVQDLKNFPLYFSSNMIAGAGKVSNMYRPILIASFALDYSLWKREPFGYHLTSIFLHTANAILIFFLVYKLFNNRFIAFFTSLFFTVHPVQSETIAYASGRTDPLYTFFAISSLLILLSILKDKKFHFKKYSVCLLLFILSLLSKETAVILPFIVILILFTDRNIKKSNSYLFIYSSPFFLIAGFYILLRLTILNFGNTLNFYINTTLTAQTDLYSKNLLIRLFTFSKVFFDYMIVLFFPKDLIMIRNVDIITTFFNPYVISFALLIILLLSASVFYWGKNKIFLFVFIFFFISILPVSGIIPINNIVAEHYLYFPLISVSLLVSSLLYKLIYKFNKPEIRSIFVIFTILIISVLAVRTIIRNFDWQDPITFYTKSLSQSPWHIPMRNNLAMAYEEVGKPDLAIQEYIQIIEKADIYPNVHHNLATAYKSLGNYKKAEVEYKRALQMDPHFIFSYYGLADLYQITGEKDKLNNIVQKLQHLNIKL